MELAKAFSKLGRKPRRSVVFILFTAEEIDLETRYFVKHLPSQFEKVEAIFDYDMVGVGDHVDLRLDTLPENFKKMLRDADQAIKIVRETTEPQRAARKEGEDIPNLYFASGGGHSRYEHYHRSTDTIYRINPEIMADIARLSFITAWAWADR
jgi:Zn-dependent M28 family amino/carboxypeptidase